MAGTDWINRKDVIDILERHMNERRGDFYVPFYKAIKDVEQLPSAERVGKWVPSHIPESILCECDQCGFDCGAYSFSYCPHCGARMESDK